MKLRAMIVIAIIGGLGTAVADDAGLEAPADAMVDAGIRDARVRDAGVGGRDAGAGDAGARDAGVGGVRDAGPRDAGIGARDAGIGARDAGIGPRDAGIGPRDAGIGGAFDAGFGGARDASIGGPFDAGLGGAGGGVRDAGAGPVDAGPDAAVRDARPRGARPDAGLGRAGGDAGPGDAGIGDGGIGLGGLDDAGIGLDDAGLDDAGLPDAGIEDAGIDAGEIDAGIIDVHIDSRPVEQVTTPPTATTETTTESTLFAIAVIGGLIALLVLAYLGGHRRVIRFQERLGISGVITAGFPFIALGVVASQPKIGILTGAVLENMRPVMLFGLGWLGFIIGAQLDIRVLERVPRGTAYLILVESVLPFVVTAAACGGVMIAFGSSWHDLSVWRDVVLLGAAAAMTAPRRFRGFANRAWREGGSADVLVTQLDDFVGVIGLLFITSYFRVDGTAWQLPDTAWVFVSLGIGVAVGALIFAMVRTPTSNAEFLAVVLGGIAFASGFAGYLRLSPIVVCFIAGVLVTNFPNDAREDVFRILRRLERPVQMLFLIVAGAVWSVTDWRGWALVPVFVIARVAGKWLGIVASRTVIDDKLSSERTLITPLSVLSIALVVSAENTYGSRTLSWVVTAVIGGAIISELLVQATPSSDDTPEPPPEPVDELDDSSGPVYIDELDERKR